jgi:hypothetical protein
LSLEALWSSTEQAGMTGEAFSVDQELGVISVTDETERNLVLCVR